MGPRSPGYDYLMNSQGFSDSLAEASPPDALSAELRALWWDAKGDWDKAHSLAQDAGSKDGDHVHAYLHRKEGDTGNAGYWYARAGAEPFDGPLDGEWRALVEALLERCGSAELEGCSDLRRLPA